MTNDGVFLFAISSLVPEILGTFSSDDEHMNVNYRKLENEP